MSYLSVDDSLRRQGESCANGGCDGASTGSESLSSGAGRTTGSGGVGSGETQRQRKSPLSPSVELERAKAKIRLLEKEVSSYLYVITFER